MKRLKKLLLLSLCLILIFAALPISGGVSANAEKSGDVVYNIKNEEAVIIGSASSAPSEITIPSEINGYPVTAISASAFEGCAGLTALTLPDTVLDIGSYAFKNCTNLEEINYSGTRADFFDIDINTGNEKLYCINVNYTYGSASTGFTYSYSSSGYTITGIGTCTDKDLILPSTYEGDNVVGIAESAFEGNENITSVYIPSTIHNINKRAFANCKNLVSAEVCGYINDTGSFSDKGYAVFFGCSSLEFFYTVDIEIRTEYSNGYYRFCPIGFWFGGYYENSTACTQLYYDTNTATLKNKTYYFPNSLKTIQLGGYDFESYTGSGYTYAFAGCTTINKVILENGISAIPDDTFYNMGGLENVIIPDSVQTIKNSAFQSCESIKSVYYHGTSDEWNAISIGEYNTSLTEADIYYYCSCGNEFDYWVIDQNATCTETGIKYRKCSACENTEEKEFGAFGHSEKNGFCIDCGKEMNVLESQHPYKNSADVSQTITKENAIQLNVTFSESTYVETDYDDIYIYDGSDTLIGSYTGKELASQTITVDGDTVTIRLDTDSYGTGYGFYAEIVPVYPETVTGDITHDNIIDADDLVLMRKAVLNQYQPIGADINFDGSVNIKDLIALKKIFANATPSGLWACVGETEYSYLDLAYIDFDNSRILSGKGYACETPPTGTAYFEYKGELYYLSGGTYGVFQRYETNGKYIIIYLYEGEDTCLTLERTDASSLTVTAIDDNAKSDFSKFTVGTVLEKAE